MSLWRKFLRGGMILTAGQLMSQGMSAVRNLLVARLLATDADFGIASILVMVVALSDMLSNLGMTTLVAQDREGDDPHFLNVAHLVAFIRGVIGATVLFVLAYPLAIAFGIPEATWAIATLSLVLLLRGLVHLDTLRLQRQHSFLPAMTQETVGQLIALAVCVPFLRVFRDYSSVVYLLLVQSAAMTVISHLVAQRDYRWSHDRVIERRIFAFGLPLLLSGLLTFGIMQGERFVMGSSGRLFPGAIYSMEDMAAFSAAFMIASLVPLLLARMLVTLFVPLLSHCEEGKFVEYNAVCVRTCTIAAGAVLIPFIIYSDIIVAIAFGNRYSTAGPMVCCIAASQAIRMIRVGAIVAVEARGFTWVTFVNNLWRATAFPGTILIAMFGMPAVWIAVPAIVGEFLSTAVVAFQARKRCQLPALDTLGPLFLLVGGMSVAGILRVSMGNQMWTVVYIVSGLIVSAGFVATWAALYLNTSVVLRNRFRRPKHQPAQDIPVSEVG